MTHTILAIIQARMSSSRLPGKVLVDIAGKPLLQHMLDRVRAAKFLNGIVLATTIDPSDDVLAQFCQEQGLPCFRGSLPDVLDRCYQAASQFHADAIVRLTADCPLIDPAVIDSTILSFLGIPIHHIVSGTTPSPDNYSPASYQFDFSANRLPPPWKRTIPIGLDVEVCSFKSLQRAWIKSDQPYQREHVMPYLYEGVIFQKTIRFPGHPWYVESGITPRGFKVALLNHDPDYGSLRWTVDTPADLEFVRQIFARFEGRSSFTWQDIVTLLDMEPELASINADVQHKSAFDTDQRSTGR